MEIELRLRIKSRDFYKRLVQFDKQSLITHPTDSLKLGSANRNDWRFEMALLNRQTEEEIGRITAFDLPLANNTYMRASITRHAEAWWRRLFVEMSEHGWTDWMQPDVVAPNATDDLMTYYLYAVCYTCANQGWEMRYMQPISEDRTFCRISAALVSEDRRYKAQVRVTLNTLMPDRPGIEIEYAMGTRDGNTAKAFADSLSGELTRSVKRWRERYLTQFVEDTVLAYMDSAAFQHSYPSAYEKWANASRLLSTDDVHTHLTTIGHLAREAMQEFATILVDRYKPVDADTDPKKTINRLSAVLSFSSGLGEKVEKFLRALVDYWRAVDGLVQREEHGGQKEGEPLTSEDARRVVFQTAIVMFEIDKALAANQ